MKQSEIVQLFYDGSTAPMDGTPIIMIIEGAGEGCAWAGKFLNGEWHIAMACCTPQDGMVYIPDIPNNPQFRRPSSFRPSYWRPEGFIKQIEKTNH
jgi:hypothetical protein